MSIQLGPFSLDRAWQGWSNVQERVRKASAALDAAGIAYAVAGGNAVALWVACIDPAAVRATPDIDILIHRNDFEATRAALKSAGFCHRVVNGLEAFLEPPEYRIRAAIHIIFAGEKVRDETLLPNPAVEESEPAPDFRVLSLDALTRVKLAEFRIKDRVHLRDMIDVGLIDASWPARYPAELGSRLQSLLDDPNG